MKALTLTQPWASLVALEEKHVETRSWSTKYRGALAIHSAKGFSGWARRMCFMPLFARTLVEHDLSPDSLPLGRILCITFLEDCVPTHDRFEAGYEEQLSPKLRILSSKEIAFGDYSAGRFAWIFSTVVKVFDPPIYAKGMLGLWEWNGRDRHER